MTNSQRIRNFLFGPPRDVFNNETKKHVALIAFMAWIGLGADGLSSSCYGPEEAFLALGSHTQLGIYLAIATAVTVFVISIAYIQVIELFPNGGGGYKVATHLLGPYAGLVSGSALIIDFVLTISISVSCSMDALLSLLPADLMRYKIYAAVAVVILLTYLNLRGMKESIRILTPIFLGFVVSHVIMIVYGIYAHADGLAQIIPNAVADSNALSQELGWIFVAALFLKAFSLGGGTYTGLEAVSNNVNSLAEPRIVTGRLTMFFVAFSLALMAAGIIILYLLWEVEPVHGKTLNAVVFGQIMQDWSIGGIQLVDYLLPMVMMFAAGLLLVAANTGFISGPNILANMGTDKWMPQFFSSLSSRLVAKNGIVLMAVAAIATILITRGEVSLLVVLYSINVFLTFSLSMLGLCLHWIRNRKTAKLWYVKLVVAGVGLMITGTILIVTTVAKFEQGGWITILITSTVIFIGIKINNRYRSIDRKVTDIDQLFTQSQENKCHNPPTVDASQPTAVLIMHETAGSGMHTLLWILRLFPNVYKNFVFVSVGTVDTDAFANQSKWHVLRRDVKSGLKYCVDYCQNHGLASTSYVSFGTDKLEKLTELTDMVIKEYPKAVFFSSKLIFDRESLFTQLLYNQNIYILQRRLHNKGYNMIILPMKV